MQFVAAEVIYVPFTVGVSDNPGKIDPADAYDSVSIDVIAQVCEGLYRYNLSGQMESIPCLAKSMGTWSADKLNLTIELRNDVKFHDGTPLNATHVKWNFDRVFDFATNKSGVTNTPQVLYLNDDTNMSAEKYVPIVNQTIVENATTIKFVLNKPWVVWEKVLAFAGSSIIKPNEAYRTTFIPTTAYKDLIGTGPFKLTNIIPDDKAVFDRFDDYYLGKANISQVVYKVISDAEVSSQAMLNHELHFGGVLPEFLAQAKADPELSVNPVKTSNVYYIQMNVVSMPFDVRKAISHAVNYSYYLKEMEGDDDYELHTPVPDGMEGHNGSIPGLAYFNRTLAREFLLNSVDPNVTAALSGKGLSAASTDNDWKAVANGSTPLFTYNFTRYTSKGVERAKNLITDNLEYIGIKVVDYLIGDWAIWSEWVTFPGNKSKLAMSFGGWAPDYNDAINMMEPIFKTGVDYNDMGLANASIDGNMSLTYSLTGQARLDKLSELQRMIMVENAPCFYMKQAGANIIYDKKHVSHIDDCLNIFANVYWYNIQYDVETILIPDKVPGYSIAFIALAFIASTTALIIKKRH
jgi:ABC-type transport system substrate-binding protein